MMRLGRNRLWE